jgi:hypothetical protein
MDGTQDTLHQLRASGEAATRAPVEGSATGQSRAYARVTLEYRVFVDRNGGELVVMHYRADKLWSGATFTANEPGTALHGMIIVVERVASHPRDDAPGIAHGRLLDRR